MTAWVSFALVATAVLVFVLVLSHATARLARRDGSASGDGVASGDGATTSGGGSATTGVDSTAVDGFAIDDDTATTTDAVDSIEATDADDSIEATDADDELSMEDLSTRALYANVLITHGGFAVVLVVAAWYADVPPAAFGVEWTTESVGVIALAIGLAVGLALALGNELASVVARRRGVESADDLRGWLAPSSGRGWLALLGFVLPLVALFEELLFRAVLIGAFAEGFGLSAWTLVVVSSILFALGHGIQGTTGVVVTGALGVALGGAFVLTGSFVVVVVAHYVVNAIEFVVHEGLSDARSAEREREAAADP